MSEDAESAALKTLGIMAPGYRRFCREAAIQNSPGLQPWVRQTKTRALKVAPDFGAFGLIKRLLAGHAPRSPLSGWVNALANPGLNPRVIMCNRFAVSRSTDRTRAKSEVRSRARAI
jgi:hypothetical protein